jgi:mannan endo-1,4-beta-mannosidase
MSAHVKKVDPNHMVTMGSEGFWGQRSPLAAKYNPGGSVGIYDGRTTWAAMTGQNFTDQHKFSTIDFCAAHYWPDMWVGAHVFAAWLFPGTGTSQTPLHLLTSS